MSTQTKTLSAGNAGAKQLSVLVKLGEKVAQIWIPRAVWHVQRSGLFGMAGIALSIGAIAFYMSSYTPLQGEVATLQDALRTSLSKRAAEPAIATEARDALGHLPEREEITKQLDVVFASAGRAGLDIEDAKYDAVETKTGDITRYKVTFPVSGRYEQIRTFVDDILARVPAMSVGELAIERKGVADQVVEARIRLTFYTRNKS